MKKIIYFLAICAYALGVIGGIGYALYNEAWPIAVGVAVVGYMAFPKLKEYVKALMS